MGVDFRVARHAGLRVMRRPSLLPARRARRGGHLHPHRPTLLQRPASALQHHPLAPLRRHRPAVPVATNQLNNTPIDPNIVSQDVVALLGTGVLSYLAHAFYSSTFK